MNQNKSKYFSFKSAFLLIVTLLFSACLKEVTKDKIEEPDKTINGINDLTVPPGFDWENSREVNFEITITDNRFGDATHSISIYDENPLAGGKLISSGSAKISNSFKTKLNIANTLSRVFIAKISPDQSEISKYVEVVTNNIIVPLGFTEQVGKKSMGKSGSPDCISNCTNTITSNNPNIIVNASDVVCVTGNNITIGITATAGLVKICGTNVTIQSANLSGSAELIITNTGSATISNFRMIGASTNFENWGVASITNSFTPEGNIINNGTLNFNNNINLSNQSTTTNNGNFNSSQNLTIDGGSIFVNNSSLVVTGNLQVNATDLFINSCFVLVRANFTNNGDFQNYSYVRINNNSSINNGAELGLYSGAMFRTLNINLSGLIKGYTSTSLVRILNNTNITSTGNITNLIQYCDINGVETNNGTFSSGAALGCSVYLPVTSCNLEGNSSASSSTTDTDGDGINDNLEDYPTDPTKAFNNYYPSSTGIATVAFEDLWPFKGDYDLNDLVMGYRYNVITNSSNVVTQIKGKFTLFATGGSLKLGFGVEFPLTFEKASNFTGGTLESGQANTVITLFSNSRSVMQNWNTDMNQPSSDSVDFNISFDVSNGPSLRNFGLNEYNPFIWNNNAGFGRGYEIHLPGKKPTSLADVSKFGSGSDNTNIAANRFYEAKNTKLPWAINIPVRFDYPTEKTDIISTYLKFGNWVQSNSVTYNDWYTNQNGYRNTTKFYRRIR